MKLNIGNLRKPIFKIVALSIVLMSTNVFAQISFDKKSAPIQFAVNKINRSLKDRGEKASIVISVDAAANLKTEGFEIKINGKEITIIAKDAAGAMYGGLDLAETIRSFGVDAIQPVQHNPYMPMRGIKFNIPLDARTPTYSAFGDATEKNTAEMWNFEFWKTYIDNIASHRYNTISLWNIQPFPNMVKLTDYPNVALNDVMLSNGPFLDVYRGDDGSDWEPKIIDYNNLRTIKKITIDQKIAFWRKVMAYGKSRNVSFYVVTWNIHTCGVNGKYGINDHPDNKITRDYYRKSVKELILTYPDLAGIGLTTGENMVYGSREAKMTDEAKEDWVAETYAAGTLDALKEQPNRKIRFIHRQHQAGVELVLDKLKTLRTHPNVDFVFSFKYAEAHVMSATSQYRHDKFVPVIKANNVKTLWTLRNDDNYLYRWGSPDFVREFMKNIPYDVSQGFYYGHDGFVTGREFTQLNVTGTRQLEVEKHWMQFMLWGRLGYDPNYSNSRIEGMLSARFPEVNGKKLLDAWQKASMVYPRVTGFHWSSLDWMWYIEGTKGIYIYTGSKGAKSTTGFHDVETFINVTPHPNSGYQSIPDFVAGKKSSNLSPLAVADLIDKEVDEATAETKNIGNITNKELQLTIDDINIISEMGRYYADKIRGATYVAMARVSKKKADKDLAVKHLIQASVHYNKYVMLSGTNHVNKLWLARAGRVDFEAQKLETIADVKIAESIEIE